MTTSSTRAAAEWHVRRQRPSPRTTVLAFVDADANRMTFPEVLDALQSSEAFRAFFITAIAESDLKTFTAETPVLTRAGDFELALTEAPLPKKLRLDASVYASHLGPDDLVASFPSPDGDGSLVAPSLVSVEGWYADLGTFVRKVRPEQVHALFATVARVAKQAMAKERVCLSSSPPGARWLHLRVGPKPGTRA